MGEEGAAGGTVRFVDSSVERVQFKVSGLIGDRHVRTCNGRVVPLQATGIADPQGDKAFDDDEDPCGTPATSVVKDAHAAGLFVHAYTFRNEAKRLASDFKGDPKAEYKLFFNLGVDGVFSDFTDTAKAARDN